MNKFKDTLEVIGKFVGTHGLAVFLVVFYTVAIYPQSQKEREQWIEQITKLRQLVDPATRPINELQADAILNISSSYFIDALSNRVQRDKQYEDLSSPLVQAQLEFRKQLLGVREAARNLDINVATVGERIDINEESVITYILGHEFVIDNSLGEEESLSEINSEVDKIVNKLSEHSLERSHGLGREYDATVRNMTRVITQLERLKTGYGDLDKIWMDSINISRDAWVSYFKYNISASTYYDLVEIKKRLQQHRYYKKWAKENNNRVSELRNL